MITIFPHDPFPPSEFDAWAETYDQSTREYSVFPFDGYDQVLETILRCADPQTGQSVLDLGTGTGNLALLFAEKGCQLTCTDFSEAMLVKAREKLPGAKFVLHDLRSLVEPVASSLQGETPAELNQRFDCIVSAYVFHHFDLDAKIRLCAELIHERLVPGGSLVIGDLSFPSFAAKETFKQHIPDWEEEFFWFADESVAGLEKAGLTAAYFQVSPCAGVYHLRAG